MREMVEASLMGEKEKGVRARARRARGCSCEWGGES